MEINIFTATAADFPSRYALGTVVYFHPGVQSMSPEQAMLHGLRARLDRVSFEKGKVTYDLAMDVSANPNEPYFYDDILVASVDSVFIATLEDLIAWTAQNSNVANSAADPDSGPVAEPVSLVKMAVASGAACVEDGERIARRFMAIAADVAEQKAENE